MCRRVRPGGAARPGTGPRAPGPGRVRGRAGRRDRPFGRKIWLIEAQDIVPADTQSSAAHGNAPYNSEMPIEYKSTDTIGQDTVMAITLPQLLAFSSFSVILAVGQLLFKDAALRNPELTGIAALSHLLQDFLFWLVIALYGAATILWVYILQQAPLNPAAGAPEPRLSYHRAGLRARAPGRGRGIRGYAPVALSSGHAVHRRWHRLVRTRAAMN